MKCGVALLPQVIDPLSGIAMIRWSVFLGSSPATGVVFCRRTANMDTRWGGEPVRGCLWRLLEAVIENTLAADVRRFTQILGPDCSFGCDLLGRRRGCAEHHAPGFGADL